MAFRFLNKKVSISVGSSSVHNYGEQAFRDQSFGEYASKPSSVTAHQMTRMDRLEPLGQPSSDCRIGRLTGATDHCVMPHSSASQQYYLALLGDAYQSLN